MTAIERCRAHRGVYHVLHGSLSPLDGIGHPHSEDLHLTERFHRRDVGHLDVQLTIEDAKMYTKPFTIKFTDDLITDSDILEYICAENEKDFAHIGVK